MTPDQLVLAIGLSLWGLVVGLTFARLRQLSAQLAVLTLRVTDLVEAVAELNTDLRAELDRED